MNFSFKHKLKQINNNTALRVYVKLFIYPLSVHGIRKIYHFQQNYVCHNITFIIYNTNVQSLLFSENLLYKCEYSHHQISLRLGSISLFNLNEIKLVI